MGLQGVIVSLLVAGIFVFVFFACLAAAFTFAVIYSWISYCLSHWNDGGELK